MKLSGMTDEAGKSIETQIQALKTLGWKHMSARTVNGTNIHDTSMDEFKRIADLIDESGIEVIEFGSLIGNWAKSVDTEFDITISEINRCIPRMQRLKVDLVRVMSYAQHEWGERQNAEERFCRLRAIVRRFEDAGLVAMHENCMNYGGFSIDHTLRLVNEVPGLKLVFDTGNPVFQRDRSKGEPYPWQDPLEFYEAVKEHVAHVHIKDCLHPPEGEDQPERYTMPGEGQARIPEILAALKRDNYQGALTIEPFVATVFHVDQEKEPDEQECFTTFVEYGRRLEGLLKDAGFDLERAAAPEA